MKSLVALLLVALVAFGYRNYESSKPATDKIEPGAYGYFTYTQIDGSTVVVSRQSPDSPAEEAK